MDRQKKRDALAQTPLFRDLTPPQIRRILDIAEERTFKTNETIFSRDESSAEILLLISGQLLVQTESGDHIATVDQTGMVGEMGVLTGEPRSANVVAARPSLALSIQQDPFLLLMEADRDLGYRIYRNATHLLCERLRENNALLEMQYLILDDAREKDCPQ